MSRESSAKSMMANAIAEVGDIVSPEPPEPHLVPASFRQARDSGALPESLKTRPHDDLRRSPLFCNLAPGEIGDIISVAEEHSYLSRQLILREGDLSTGVFLLNSGFVKITQLSSTGDEVILRIKKPGDVIGGLGMSFGETHSSGAQALEPCQVLVWDNKLFEALCECFPLLRRNALRILSDSLQVLEQCFCELATQRVSSRLARTILRLYDDRGTSENKLAFTCEELGQMTGTSLFTVSRLLCKWAELGLIQPEHRNITIKDAAGLLALADGEMAA